MRKSILSQSVQLTMVLGVCFTLISLLSFSNAALSNERLTWADLDKLAEFKCEGGVDNEAGGVAISNSHERVWLAEYIDPSNPRSDRITEYPVLDFKRFRCPGCFEIKLKISVEVEGGFEMDLGSVVLQTRGRMDSSTEKPSSLKSVTQTFFDQDGNQDGESTTVQCD